MPSWLVNPSESSPGTWLLVARAVAPASVSESKSVTVTPESTATGPPPSVQAALPELIVTTGGAATGWFTTPSPNSQDLILSRPGPPRQVSLPLPPMRVSRPPFPYSLSLPSPPQTTSFRPSPLMVSLPPSPAITSAFRVPFMRLALLVPFFVTSLPPHFRTFAASPRGPAAAVAPQANRAIATASTRSWRIRTRAQGHALRIQASIAQEPADREGARSGLDDRFMRHAIATRSVRPVRPGRRAALVGSCRARAGGRRLERGHLPVLRRGDAARGHPPPEGAGSLRQDAGDPLDRPVLQPLRPDRAGRSGRGHLIRPRRAGGAVRPLQRPRRGRRADGAGLHLRDGGPARLRRLERLPRLGGARRAVRCGERREVGRVAAVVDRQGRHVRQVVMTA